MKDNHNTMSLRKKLNKFRALLLVTLCLGAFGVLKALDSTHFVYAQAGALMSKIVDTDNDGMIDAIDLDDDNDWISDIAEGNGLVDTDGDNVPDSRDMDSDNDGIPDKIEVRSNAGDATMDDRVWSDTNCEMETILQTNTMENPTILVTRNTTGTTLELFQLDEMGARISHGEIASGETISLTTFASIPYLFVYAETGECAYTLTNMSGERGAVELPGTGSP